MGPVTTAQPKPLPETEVSVNTQLASALVPLAGAPVVVLSKDGDRIAVGELTVWSASDLVTTARVRLDPLDAVDLIDHQVFARINSNGTLIVLKAHARPTSGSVAEVELVGVKALALEARRASLRAQLVRDLVLISEDAGPKITVSTVDLSTGGCRVTLPHGTTTRVGERFSAVLTDGQGGTIWLRSEVVRTNPVNRQAALRFVDVAAQDAERIDREVLDWHAEQH